MLQATDGTERRILNGFLDASLMELAQNNIVRVRTKIKIKATQK